MASTLDIRDEMMEKIGKGGSGAVFLAQGLRLRVMAGLVVMGLLLGGCLLRAPAPTDVPLAELPAAQVPAVEQMATETTAPPATDAPTQTPIPATALPPTATPAPTLGVGSAMIREADGMRMVYVPEGVFTMGTNLYGEKPAHEVYLDAFWIDQYEVTIGQYAQCVAAGACTVPYTNTSKTRGSYYDNPAYASYPVVNINWDQADAYCRWAGVSLPTEAQWEKAARGTTPIPYPWGVADLTCEIVNFDGCVGDTVMVGSYPQNASPYGALDMAGNVREWVADLYDLYYYSSSPDTNPIGPAESNYRVMRGGSWHDPAEAVRTSRRFWTLPSDEFDWLGFRCAQSVVVAP